MKLRLISTLVAIGFLAACEDNAQVPADPGSPPAVAASDGLATIPEDLAPFGDGFPVAGDPCRNLGESAATIDYLDDSAILVGCPDEASAGQLAGELVGNIRGVLLVSVPMGDANAGMNIIEEVPDLADPLTGYNATAPVKCGFDYAGPTEICQAGVKRRWNGPNEHLVEVTKPDGRKRAIYFRGTDAYGADSAEADGSAGWQFKATTDGDQILVNFGPEAYVIVEALVVGG